MVHIPFGPDCEFADMEACVRKYKGKKADPEAYCATIMRETEKHCQDRMARAALGDNTHPPHLRWQYDATATVFEDGETGSQLDQSRLADLLADFLERQRTRITGETDDLASSFSTVPEWEIGMRRIIKETWGASYLLGRGGRAAMTQADWGQLGRLVLNQYLWLNQFAHKLGRGELTVQQATARAAQYTAGARHAYSLGVSAALGNVPLPAHPADGSTSCMNHCSCRWDIQTDPAGGWRATWLLGDTDHCPDCTARSVHWAPLQIGASA